MSWRAAELDAFSTLSVGFGVGNMSGKPKTERIRRPFIGHEWQVAEKRTHFCLSESVSIQNEPADFPAATASVVGMTP